MALANRHFPPSWSIDEQTENFIVKGTTGGRAGLRNCCGARGCFWPLAAAPVGDSRGSFRGYSCHLRAEGSGSKARIYNAFPGFENLHDITNFVGTIDLASEARQTYCCNQ